MRRTHLIALAAAAALVAGACSTTPCQRLGEKLCGCTGLAGDLCTTQVEDQLKTAHPTLDTQDECQKFLDTCVEPSGTIFCEWLNTTGGKVACGLAEPALITTTTP